MAGRRRVDDDELILTLRDGVGEGAKDRDLLGARRAQVFFEQRAALRVEPLAGGREDFLGVASRFGGRIDTRDAQRRGPLPRRRVHVRGRIGGGQHHLVARPGELGRDAHGERRLADAALAHRHHHALAARRDLLDQLVQCLAVLTWTPRRRRRVVGGRAPVGSHLPQRIDTDQAERQQRYVDARKAAQACGHVVEGGTPARLQGHGDGIVRVLRVEDAIENQPHVPNPELVELAARALGLRERWAHRDAPPGQASSVRSSRNAACEAA